MTEAQSLVFVRKLAATAACASVILALALPADRIGYLIFAAFWAMLHVVVRALGKETSSAASGPTPSAPFLPMLRDVNRVITANALGIKIPPTTPLRADRVIE